MELELGTEALALCRKRIEEGIRGIVGESGSSGVVIGLSGGVDSSLVFRLAVSSGVKVHALIMPEKDITSEEDVRDAVDLARSMDAPYSIIEIEPVLRSLEKAFPWEEFPGGEKKVSLGNAKARVRMTLNYLAANMGGSIVLGTGNKTEILLGYSTKYGDGGVDIQPIGGLYKTQVRQMAKNLGVPGKIINKVPTAGLWRGQTDEGEIGARYEDIDRILFCLVDEGLGLEETANRLSLSASIVKRISGLMKKNRHKRHMPRTIPMPWD